MDDFVLKCCCPAIDKVYDALSHPGNVKFATRVVLGKQLKNGMHILEIRPVGFPEAPQSLEELRVALRCVLTALAELHQRGIVHRDVRWPNILKYRDGWILSDFEMADFVGSVLPPGAIASAHLPPELQSDSGACYGSEGDIFCVGKLVEDWRGAEPLPADVREWSRRLMNADPKQRPSARQLLDEEGSWLVAPR